MNMDAVPSPQRVNLLGLDRAALEEWFAGIGEKRFRASQVMKWTHQHGVLDFSAMTNLSKALRERLEVEAELRPPSIDWEQLSTDGTRKWLVKLDCGNRVETVFIPQEGRGTLCVSTQVGCALECSFCSTAQQGFNRNLSSAEIIGQVWLAREALGDEAAVTNVVLMGMGEPLLNFDAVVKATNLMMEDFAYGFSKRRVTLSTSGVIPALDRLREVSDISLALSLHAPNDALRDELVPLNRKYPLKPLLEACRRYVGRDKRRVTMEYVLLEGVNDEPAQARELARLLKGYPAKLNLIPFNPFPGTRYRRSSPARIEAFSAILQRAGLLTTTRRTRGDDIDAACGQLVGQVRDRSRRQQRRVEHEAGY